MIWALTIIGVIGISMIAFLLFCEFGPGIVTHPIAGFKGRRAFHRGLVPGDNPYCPWTERRKFRAWAIGFKDERLNDWIHYGTTQGEHDG